MNTTNLIRYWSMSGADRDLTDRFGSVGGVDAASAAPLPDERVPERAPLLMRTADDEDWTPLVPA
jgi:hypothetical protein